MPMSLEARKKIGELSRQRMIRQNSDPLFRSLAQRARTEGLKKARGDVAFKERQMRGIRSHSFQPDPWLASLNADEKRAYRKLRDIFGKDEARRIFNPKIISASPEDNWLNNRTDKEKKLYRKVRGILGHAEARRLIESGEDYASSADSSVPSIPA